MMPRMNAVMSASWTFPSGSLQPKYLPPQPTSAMNIAIAIPPATALPPLTGELLTGAWLYGLNRVNTGLNLPPNGTLTIGAAEQDEAKPMKARVFITLKNGVLDPQGKAIHHALEGLGFAGVNDVRAGKLIELDLADGTSDAAIEEMCRKLLANTVIENFRIERLETAQA